MAAYEPYIPEDFDIFWSELVAEAASVRLNFERKRVDYPAPEGFVVDTLAFDVIGGRRLNGWIAYPEGARRLPGFLWLPPYGRESVLPNYFGTRNGFVSMSLNFHGEPAFHQEKYVRDRGYFAVGAAHAETWIFRRMTQDAMVAARVLQAQLEVDESRIGAMGMSQGGGMALWLAAFCPTIRAVCADMPFLCAINHTLSNPVHRYPLKELVDFMTTIPIGQERVLNTLSYFDTMNVATRCTKPTQISKGLKDPACRPDTVQAAYEVLPGTRLLRTYDWGHDWHPDMIDNNRRWLLDNL